MQVELLYNVYSLLSRVLNSKQISITVTLMGFLKFRFLLFDYSHLVGLIRDIFHTRMSNKSINIKFCKNVDHTFFNIWQTCKGKNQKNQEDRHLADTIPLIKLPHIRTSCSKTCPITMWSTIQMLLRYGLVSLSKKLNYLYFNLIY